MKKKQIIALTLGVLLSSTLVADPSIAQATTTDEVKSKIEANQNKIDELEDKKSGLQESKSESAQKLDEAKANFNKQNELLTQTREKVFGFEKEINTLQKQIDEFEAKIRNIEDEITKVKEAILKKQDELTLKEEILGKRIRNTYMSNIADRMIYMLIESKNFGDLISNIANINIIIKTDQELITDIENDKAIIEEEQVNLINKEKELNDNKNSIVISQNKLIDDKAEVEKLEAEYATEAEKLKELEDIRTNEYNALNQEEKAIQEEISRYEHDTTNLEEYFKNLSKGPAQTSKPQVENESNSNESINNGNSSNSGNNNNNTSNDNSSNDNNQENTSQGGQASTGFIKPLSAPITSHYGQRTHPITGKPGTFHSGTDFGAPTGTPVKAIASGTVTTAGWNNSFGNMVVIDHGNGYSSLYAHNSSLNVSVGQKVSQGQVVSLVGSTGNSTGPHLHLEMRYNGSHVNPENYIR
ncbi:MAG: peptidoglycan DD-metalloendopeptidase family protein [Sarcina sp.]